MFSQEEFASRLWRVQERMADQQFDLLIVTDPCNICYLTGYDGWSFYTPQALLVPLEGEVRMFTRAMDLPGVLATSRLTAEDVFEFEDALVQSPTHHPFEMISDKIQQTWPNARKIGLEMESYYFSIRAYRILEVVLENVEFMDANFLVNWVRFVKSDAEIALMRQAGVLLGKSFDAAFESLVPGARECDVAAAIYAANLEGNEDIGGNYTSSPAFILTNEKARMPHLPWTTQTLKDGDQVNLELMGNHKRYQVTMGRTAYLGTPPQKLYDLERIVQEAIQATLEIIRPGVTCHEVADTVYRSYARHGIDKKSRCGYSLGITYPPTGGELTASLRLGDETMLQEGSTMHLLPAIWDGDTSFMMSEPFVVTTTGAECLANVKRRLFYKD